jgi:hypothetical protein
MALLCGGEITKYLKDDFRFTKQASFFDEFRAFINASGQTRWYGTEKAIAWQLNHGLKVRLAGIATKFGISYTFNMIESSKLLNTSECVVLLPL